MSNAIEELKGLKTNWEIIYARIQNGTMAAYNLERKIRALGEAIVCLEQKDKGCPKCGNIIKLGLYCNRCYKLGKKEAKKQGALEELERIEEAWHHIGSKRVCNYIEKRIKELEEEGVEK